MRRSYNRRQEHQTLLHHRRHPRRVAGPCCSTR